jgi:nucleoside-diphosphate-sugar epimerase
MSKVLVTGGCGYVGSVLVPKLIDIGYDVTVVDTQWFGNFLPKHLSQLRVLKKSVNDIHGKDLQGISTVIHLANIANDPGVELNPTLSWEINTLHLNQLLFLCRKVGIEKFLNASSGSVYGVKSEERVTEDLQLEPISVYNKTKLVAERVSRSFSGEFQVYNIRPATVCGYSPRMRLDVVVNMFVWQAFQDKKIRVLGGDQIRPNIHIEDMVSTYVHFLEKDDIPPGDYNAGFENLRVAEIAELIAQKYGATIEFYPSNDPRSYRLDSTKLLKTGFLPQFGVNNAIDQIWQRLESGSLRDDERWHTVGMMKKLGL